MTETDRSAYWKTVIDTMADGLMIVDQRGVILSVNAALEAITGYRADELIGKVCRVLDCDTCSKSRAGDDEAFCSLFRDGRIRRCRCTLRRKDGAPLYVMKNASVLRDENGQVIGGVETVSDLSETIARETLITDLQQELSGKDGFRGLIGDAPAMQGVYGLIAGCCKTARGRDQDARRPGRCETAPARRTGSGRR